MSRTTFSILPRKSVVAFFVFIRYGCRFIHANAGGFITGRSLFVGDAELLGARRALLVMLGSCPTRIQCSGRLFGWNQADGYLSARSPTSLNQYAERLAS